MNSRAAALAEIERRGVSRPPTPEEEVDHILAGLRRHASALRAQGRIDEFMQLEHALHIADDHWHQDRNLAGVIAALEVARRPASIEGHVPNTEVRTSDAHL
jgi:hypothetical protein